MRLLVRIALVWIVLGLVTGLFLRTRKRLKLAWVLGLSFAPWLLHQLYILVMLGFVLPSTQLITFLGFSLLFIVLGSVFAWRYQKQRSLTLAALPLVHGVLYSGLLFWLSRITQTDGLGLNTVSWVVYASAVLFMTSLLFSFLFRVATPKLPSLGLRRTKK
jgi:hypothetical protein